MSSVQSTNILSTIVLALVLCCSRATFLELSSPIVYLEEDVLWVILVATYLFVIITTDRRTSNSASVVRELM